MKWLQDRRVRWFAGVGLALRLVVGVAPAIRLTVVVLGLVCLLVGHGDGVGSDKALTLVLCVVGLAPVLGWVPGLSHLVDPLACCAVISILLSARDIANDQVRLHWEAIPAAASASIGLAWWWPVSRVGSASAVLPRLLAGWDHVGHFAMMMIGARYDALSAVAPATASGPASYYANYPSGIQLAWAQWWRLPRGAVTAHPLQFLEPYLHSVIVTLALTVGIIVLCVTRLAERRFQRLVAGTAVAGLVAALFITGPLSITVWFGFPNFGIALAGCCAAISLALRPVGTPWIDWVALTGALALAAYNWYPAVLPAAVLCCHVLWSHLRSATRRRRIRLSAAAALTTTIVAAAMLSTLSLGLHQLSIGGAIPPLSGAVFDVCLVGGLAVAGWILRRGATLGRLASVSPVVIGPALIVVVAHRVQLANGTYPYYAQKIGYLAATISLLSAAMLVVHELGAHPPVRPQLVASVRRARAFQLVTALLVALTATQAFGYAGPNPLRLDPNGASTGSVHRAMLVNTGQSVSADLWRVIDSVATQAAHRPRVERACLLLFDPSLDGMDQMLASLWMSNALWGFTNELTRRLSPVELTQARLVSFRNRYAPQLGLDAYTAEFLDRHLDPATACPVVSPTVAAALVRLDPTWVGRLWVVNPDDSVTPPNP
jgi:hypothetical protein